MISIKIPSEVVRKRFTVRRRWFRSPVLRSPKEIEKAAKRDGYFYPSIKYESQYLRARLLENLALALPDGVPITLSGDALKDLDTWLPIVKKESPYEHKKEG